MTFLQCWSICAAIMCSYVWIKTGFHKDLIAKIVAMNFTLKTQIFLYALGVIMLFTYGFIVWPLSFCYYMFAEEK